MNLITGISQYIKNIAIFKQLLADNANKLKETFNNSEKALSNLDHHPKNKAGKFYLEI